MRAQHSKDLRQWAGHGSHDPRRAVCLLFNGVAPLIRAQFDHHSFEAGRRIVKARLLPELPPKEGEQRLVHWRCHRWM